ncbi:unnamed protein product [Ilex paraguariensis]|uniref:Uncharacterized protein n=1 Tax=Ilex paraguariensis TaxID=185542 RepID=A0ABC8QP35_9AQUA
MSNNYQNSSTNPSFHEKRTIISHKTINFANLEQFITTVSYLTAKVCKCHQISFLHKTRQILTQKLESIVNILKLLYILRFATNTLPSEQTNYLIQIINEAIKNATLRSNISLKP